MSQNLHIIFCLLLPQIVPSQKQELWLEIVWSDVEIGKYEYPFITGDITNWKITPMEKENENTFSYRTIVAPNSAGTFVFLKDFDWNSKETLKTCKVDTREYKIRKADMKFIFEEGECESVIKQINEIPVVFELDAKNADLQHGMFIAGDFTNWEITKMSKDSTLYRFRTLLNEGASGEYVFLNSPSWIDKETFQDSDCGENYNRRYKVSYSDKNHFQLSWNSCEDY